MKLEQISVSNVGLLSGREKKKREIGMARKMAENREGSLGFPGFVKPVFTKDSPLPRSDGNNILVVMYYFTNWPEAYPILTKSPDCCRGSSSTLDLKLASLGTQEVCQETPGRRREGIDMASEKMKT
ncbi:hypothetical protein TNCV_4358211 [Trichonephila clavipes]|nr:hypothetical protein TNCV_4358211 [Trichonephila clavipes]